MMHRIESELIGLKAALLRHDEEMKRILTSCLGGDNRSTGNVLERWLAEACAENARLRQQNEQLRKLIADER